MSGQELQHIGRSHLCRILRDHVEEDLQIECDHQPRVVPRPCRDERQIGIQQRMPEGDLLQLRSRFERTGHGANSFIECSSLLYRPLFTGLWIRPQIT